MAKYSNTVEYNLKTTLDASGVSKLQAELRNVQTELQRLSGMNLIGKNSANSAIAEINKIEKAMNKAFNPSLGMLDLRKFSTELKTSGGDIRKWGDAFNLAGTKGQVALLDTIGQLNKLDTGLRSVSKTTDKVFNTIGNTVRWGLIASAFQGVMNSAHQAVDYIKDLDKSLNDIRIVSEYSAKDMREFSLYANDAAKALGQTTVAYTNASLIFAQQGFNLEDSEKLAEMTLKVANTTGQETAEVSEQITSWMNGYQMSLDQVENTLDKVTKVAAVGAADTEELMIAASKVASTANMLGVSEDQLITQMSTIISVTREAPENVGNALKTIYARLGDLQMGDTLEDGTNLGNLSSTLEKVGVQVLDDTGAMRNMGDVLEELMGKWQDFSSADKQALAVKLAGKYQYTRFSALMENQEMYNKQLEESMNADGFLERTQGIYMDSLEAKTKQLQAATEGLISNVFDPDAMKPFVEQLTSVVTLFDNLIDSIGGAQPLILGLSGAFTRLFSKNIGQGLNNFLNNREVSKQIRHNQYGRQILEQQGLNANQFKDNESVNRILQHTNAMGSTLNSLSEQQKENYSNNLSQWIESEKAVIALEEELKIKTEAVNSDLKDRIVLTENIDLIKKDPITGTYNTGLAEKEKFLGFDFEQARKGTTDQRLNLETGAQNFVTGVGSMQQALESLSGASKITEKDFDNLDKHIDNMITALEQMRNSGIASEEVLELLSNAVLDLINVADKSDASIDDMTNSLNQMGLATDRIMNVVKQGIAKGLDSLGLDEIQILNSQLEDAKAKRQQAENAGNKQLEDSQRTVQIQQITQLASGVMQLGFAWQSFQSLGSIWSNADLTDGEKFQQILMNLIMTIPSLVFAFVELNQGIKVAKQLFTDFHLTTVLANKAIELTELINLKYAASASAAATAQTAENAAVAASVPVNASGAAGFTGLADSVRDLTAALLASPLAPVIGVLTTLGAIVGVVAAGMGAAAEQQKQYEESINSLVENQKEIDEAISNSNYNTLLEEYQKTGKASEEFKTSSLKVAEALETEGAKSLIAAENYDVLNERIDNSIKKHNELSEAALKAQEAALIKKQNNYGLFQDDLKHALQFSIGGGGNNNIIEDLGLTNDIYGPDVKSMENISFKIDSGRTKALEEQAELTKKLTENTKKLGVARIENNKTEESKLLEEKRNLQNQIEENQKLVANYETLYSNENYGIKDAIENNAALAEISVNKLTESISKNTNGLEIVDKLLNSGDKNIQNYFIGATTNAEKLKRALELVKDEALSLNLNNALILEEGQSNLIDRLSGLTDANGNQVTQKKAEEVSKSIIDRINNSKLKDEDKIKFIGKLDELSFSQINEQLIQAEKDGTLSPIILHGKFDNNGILEKSTIDSSELKDILDNAGIEEDTFNTYKDLMSSRNSENNQGIIDRIKDSSNKKSRAADDAKAALKHAEAEGKTAEEIEKKADAYKKASIAANIAKKAEQAEANNTKDVAAKSIKAASALDDLSENFESYGSILRKADKNSLQYAETLTTVKQDLGDLTGIDPEIFDEQFIQDNLGLIEQAAQGNGEAIDQLRAKTSEKIIAELELEGVSPEEAQAIKDQLTSIGQDLSAQAAEMPVDMTIDADAEPAFETLNNLLYNGQITAEQMQALMNSWGLEPEIEMVDGPPSTTRSTGTFYIGGDGNYGTPSIPISWSSEMQTTVQVPQITNAKSLGGGAGLAKSGTSSKSSRSPGSKGKSGGSGGGGGGKSYEPKTKDPIEEEIDRYERVNTLLSAVEKDYSKINKERDRLTSFDKTDSLNKEIDLLQKQILLHQEKLNIQKQEAEELKGDLTSKYGATFDADGFLTNYQEIHRRLESDVNSLINQYVNTTDEAGQEALDKRIEDSQKILDAFKEDYKRYDDLVSSDLKETINTLEDLKDSIEDLRIETLKAQITAADSVKDINEALHEFNGLFDARDEDDPFRNMEESAAKLKDYFDNTTTAANNYYDNLIAKSKEKLSDPAITDSYRKYLTEQIELMEQAKNVAGDGSVEEYGTGYFDMAMHNMATMLDQIHQFEQTGSSSIFGENTAEMYETAKEAFEQASNYLKDFKSDAKKLQEDILNGIDDMSERIDERKEQYENIVENLEHQRDLTEMLYGDKAYQKINAIYTAQQNNYQVAITEMQSNLEMWKKLLNNLKEGSEEWKKVNEQIVETQKELNDLVEKSLENYKQQYENNLRNTLNTWSDSPFTKINEDGKEILQDLEWMEQEWQLINRNADYYLDQTNAAYEVQKLQGKYLQLLDGSNDLLIQQQITDQMKKQLAHLREKDNLSQYDIAYANAQLEILQKRIALEEAQRNKNQIKLRRDSQGNYSYVYTADKSDVADKEADLLNAQQNAYNLSKDQMVQTQGDSLSALGDAKNLLDNIWTDANLTLEQKQDRTRTIIDSLKEYLTATSEQFSTSEKNLINDFLGMCDILTEENSAKLADTYAQLMADNTEALDNIDTRFSTSLTSWLRNIGDFNVKTEAMFDSLTANGQNYEKNVKITADKVKTDFSDMSGAIAEAENATNKLVEAQKQFSQQLGLDSSKIQEYEKILGEYTSKTTDAENAMKAYKQQAEELATKYAQAQQENAAQAAQLKEFQSTINAYESGALKPGGGSGGNGKPNPTDQATVIGVAQNIWTYGFDTQKGGWNNDPGRAASLREYGGDSFRDAVQSYINSHQANGGAALVNYNTVQYSRRNLLGYDTGGYTGEWNDPNGSGRLALLHQKELVLNQQDTTNILQAVQAVREMTTRMKNTVFDNIVSNLKSFDSPMPTKDDSSVVQQEVHITAEFPNVSDSDDIREALLSLNDKAMQYSSRIR